MGLRSSKDATRDLGLSPPVYMNWVSNTKQSHSWPDFNSAPDKAKVVSPVRTKGFPGFRHQVQPIPAHGAVILYNHVVGNLCDIAE